MNGTLLLVLLGAMAAFAQDASVEGVAVNGQTGEPMPGVHVRLMLGSVDGIAALYGAMTGADGRFSITSIVPGAYYLSADRRGYMYVPSESPAPMIRVKRGDRRADLKISMFRHAVITGRVLDQYGDPAPHASVQARPADTASGVQNLRSPGGFMQADERGEYRLTVPPGKFHVQATPMQRGHFGTPETRTDGTSEPAYVATYYPTGATAEQAVAVETTAGAEVSGIDIVLANSRGMLTVSGTVTGLPAERPFATVTMMRGDRADSSSSGTGVRAGGKFTFTRVEPGTVRLLATHQDGDTRLYSPVVEIHLGSADVTNIDLPLAPGADLTGRLEVPGEAPAVAARTKRKVALMPIGANAYGMSPRSPAEVDKDGGFRIPGVGPGRFRIVLEGLPEDAYVRTVSLDGTVLQNQIIDFSHASRSATLRLTVGLNGGRLGGTVLEKPGEPVPNFIGGVYLVLDPENVRPENMARVDGEGKFQFKGLRPGKYRLFVIDSMRMRILWGPDTVKKLAAEGEQIEIREGDRITKDVTLAAKEASGAR